MTRAAMILLMMGILAPASFAQDMPPIVRTPEELMALPESTRSAMFFAASDADGEIYDFTQLNQLTRLFTEDGSLRLLRQVRGIRELRCFVSNADEGLANLAGWTELEEVHLIGSGDLGVGVGNLKSCKSLRKIVLEGVNLTAAGARLLGDFDNLRVLEAVDCSSSSTQQSNLSTLAQMPGLEVLATHTGTLSRVVLDALRTHPTLSRLELRYTGQASRTVMAGLADVPSLKKLDLREAELGVGFTKPLREHPGLEEVLFQIDELSDEQVLDIASCPNLRSLGLHHCSGFTDAAIQGLKGHARLETLDLSHCRQLTQKSVEAISVMPNLRRLSASHPWVDDNSILKLYSMEHLKELNLYGVELTEGSARDLQKLKSLESLRLSYCKLPDSYLVAIAKVKQLSRLYLEYTFDVGDEQLAELTRLPELVELACFTSRLTEGGIRVVVERSPFLALWITPPRNTDYQVTFRSIEDSLLADYPNLVLANWRREFGLG